MPKIRSHAFAALLMITSPVFALVPQEVPQAKPSDEIPIIDAPAQPIVDRVREYYRGLRAVTCTAEASVKLETRGLDELVYIKATAVRPNRVSIFANERRGLFTTNQFVCNGTELFEESTRRFVHMLSPAPADFDEMYARVAARSAPNMPVEVILALLTSNPIENVMHLDVEPGLIRLAGESDVNGVRCHELVVNEMGSRVWVRAENPPWIMRYQNSPVVAKPRYMPPGSQYIGPVIRIDFKTWSIPDLKDHEWTWVVPERSEQRATIHESSKGGPEDGYTSMLLEENETPKDQGTSLQVVGRNGESGNRPVGLAVGTKAPDVKLTKLDDTLVPLAEVRADRPAVLVFWVPGAKFSKASVPRLLVALKSLGDSIKVIPIGSGGSIERVEESAKSNTAFRNSFADPDGMVARSFNVHDVFAVVLLDSKGRVHRHFIGPMRQVEKRVQSACDSMIAQETEDPSTDKESEKTDDPDS